MSLFLPQLHFLLLHFRITGCEFFIESQTDNIIKRRVLMCVGICKNNSMSSSFDVRRRSLEAKCREHATCLPLGLMTKHNWSSFITTLYIISSFWEAYFTVAAFKSNSWIHSFYLLAGDPNISKDIWMQTAKTKTASSAMDVLVLWLTGL